jgi:hypothetical protein
MYRTKLRYNAEAQDLLKLLPKFDYECFEKWVSTLVLQIGAHNVIQYLEEKNRWGMCMINPCDENLKVDLSLQAKDLISLIPDFDVTDCVRWFRSAVCIGKNDVLAFIDSVSKK